jgi:hypothetical protein
VSIESWQNAIKTPWDNACPGCSVCGGYDDVLQEELLNSTCDTPILPNGENGDLFKLQLNTFHDRETGQIDLDGITFVPVLK